MTSITVVVVTYESETHIDGCLGALAADLLSPTFEVLVVDNASTDRSVEIADGWAQRDSRFRVLCSGTNRGYAGGVNLALPMIGSDLFAVLNPDCRVRPGWLGPLIAALGECPEAAVVNPLILLSGDPSQVNSAGQNIHVTGLGFNRLLGHPAKGVSPDVVSVPGLHGAAFVIRRRCLEEVGGWDESGFLYHEDVALSWLMRLRGYDILCAPSSIVEHDYVLSMTAGKFQLLEANRWRCLATHLKPLTAALLSPALMVTEALLWAYALLKGRGFLRAKFLACKSVWNDWRRIEGARRASSTLRRRGDYAVLANFRWQYDWDQLVSLGAENPGRPRRAWKDVARRGQALPAIGVDRSGRN